MNFTFGGSITGLIMIAIGSYLVYDAYNLNHHVLFLSWAEQKWGPGSGTLAYKIIGLALIGLAFLIISGLFDPFASPFDSATLNRGNSTTNTQTPNFTPSNSVQLSS